jgi:phage regulator Rha-like protein
MLKKDSRKRYAPGRNPLMVTRKVSMQKTKDDSPILMESIENLILRIRGINLLIDSDLAELYGVTTKALNQAVKRNRDRFPHDFVFQLNKKEKIGVVTNCDHLARLKYSPTLPYVFTEHGAIMAANVLKSDRAVKISVYVVRAFVKLREALLTQKDFAGKLREMEQKVEKHDVTIHYLLHAIRRLMQPPNPQKTRRIGFNTDED